MADRDAIERAAKAVAWDRRPLIGSWASPEQFWTNITDEERTNFLTMAQVALSAAEGNWVPYVPVEAEWVAFELLAQRRPVRGPRDAGDLLIVLANNVACQRSNRDGRAHPAAFLTITETNDAADTA